ncbi:uncharacterized protein MKS88_000233 [Plasmodium brasilianum]|uniref:uncharacterized protein n=1 Tax=Plasmodium brasilianum TaxID=5824 RepID=UPI00350E4989|nr:hypothetical protein MKS88_000233 [Plasmodium brasilianum]
MFLKFYLLKKRREYSDRVKRCNYLNYRINIEEIYNSSSLLYQKYNKFSDDIGNICNNKQGQINSVILEKLTELYNLYEGLRNFTYRKNDARICENPKKCYEFYVEHYKECEEIVMNEFCGGLSKFKKTYDETMGDTNIYSHVPKNLAPPKSYAFAASLTITF